VTISTGHFHIRQLKKYEFSKNQSIEYHTLLKGLNEMLSIFSTFVMPVGCGGGYVVNSTTVCVELDITFLDQKTTCFGR